MVIWRQQGGKGELKCHADVTEVSQSHGRPWSWNGPFKLFCVKVRGPGFFPASITGCGLSVGRGHGFEWGCSLQLRANPRGKLIWAIRWQHCCRWGHRCLSLVRTPPQSTLWLVNMSLDPRAWFSVTAEPHTSPAISVQWRVKWVRSGCLGFHSFETSLLLLPQASSGKINVPSGGNIWPSRPFWGGQNLGHYPTNCAPPLPPWRGTAITDSFVCSVFPFAAPFSWDALCLAFPHVQLIIFSSFRVQCECHLLLENSAPHPPQSHSFQCLAELLMPSLGPQSTCYPCLRQLCTCGCVGLSPSELLKARDWISPHLYLWTHSETDSVDELPGWRRELENFDSGMKESSQAEEKLWWIELERVPVKKPSREASHPWLDLQGFTWNPLWISPLPSLQVVLSRVSIPCPVWLNIPAVSAQSKCVK